MIDDFLAWCARDRGRSPNTIARYRITLTAAEASCGNLIAADVASVEAWWETRYEQAPATRGNELACLRSFYKWATRFDHRPDDPTRRLDYPKIPIKQPRPAGKSDLDRLLGELTEDAPDLRRAIALGAYGGLRVSEAAALDWSTIDEETRVIYVTGKGVKERMVPISAVLWDWLLPELAAGNVVTAGGRVYQGDTLQRRINRLMRAGGVGHTYHDLRKRGATLALSRTKNPLAVAQVFGWESLQTAQHYARFDDDVLRQIAEAMV